MNNLDSLSNKLKKFNGLINLSVSIEIFLFIKKNFKSKGDIIELGTFLGKTTKTITEAIQGSFTSKVYSYDNFIWNWNHKRKFPNIKLNVNQNFLEYVKKKVNSKKVIFKKGRIEDLSWQGKKIELLILDAPKNFDEINDVFFKLLPFFQKNITKIIFLDFTISIKYDTQIFLSKISDNFSIDISKNGVAYCKYVKKIDYKKFQTFSNEKKANLIDINFFWNKMLNTLNKPVKKKLSLLPALHLYDNKYYLESTKYVFYKNVHVQKKYILTKYMLKRYPLLIPTLIIQYLRGKYFI